MEVEGGCCERAKCNSAVLSVFCFFQAEDGIRDLVRSRGLGDVYKRQVEDVAAEQRLAARENQHRHAKRLEVVHHRKDFRLSLIHI